jgi:small subunit ribosomal protein S10e
LVAKKDHFKAKHSDELDVKNLEVIGLLRSLVSKGYVKETFNWQYYYWYLTNEGIEYLRTYLALPSEVVPNTLKQPAVQAKPTPTSDEQQERRNYKGKGGPGGDYKPRFEGKDRQDGYRNRERREGGDRPPRQERPAR